MAGEELDYNRELEAIVKFSNPRYSHCFVRSDGWFETPNSVFITMEYLELGDLQSHLAHPLHEFDARDITAQIIEGLHIMHENDFVHRDLKPGNIMVVSRRPWFVKIADFGISKRRLDDVTSLRTLQRGTFGFAAPEIFGLGSGADVGSYTSAVDMWSLGAVVHKILTGNPPFQGLSEVFKYISGQASFPMADLQKRDVSENGQDFVSKLMAESPKDRLTAARAAQHPWMTMHLDAPEDLTITSDAISKVQYSNVTITSASGCWTTDHTVTELRISTQGATATPVHSNYKSPYIEDCPPEPNVDPLNALPEDSPVLLTEASAPATEVNHEPPGESRTPSPGDRELVSPASNLTNDVTQQTSFMVNPVEATIDHLEPSMSEGISVDEPFEELMRRHPTISSAYEVLIKAIHGIPDLKARGSLQRVLASNLLLAAGSGPRREGSDTRQGTGEAKNPSPRLSGSSQDEQRRPCRVCSRENVPGSSAILRCLHRWCWFCLGETFRSALDNPMLMPPRCCGWEVPVHLVGPLFNARFRKDWNKTFKKQMTRLVCPNIRCGRSVAYNEKQIGEVRCGGCSHVVRYAGVASYGTEAESRPTHLPPIYKGRSEMRHVKSHVVLEANDDLGSDSADSGHERELIRAVKTERARGRPRTRQDKIEPARRSEPRPQLFRGGFTGRGPDGHQPPNLPRLNNTSPSPPASNQKKGLDIPRYAPSPPPVEFEEEEKRRARARQEGRPVVRTDRARESRTDDRGYDDEDTPRYAPLPPPVDFEEESKRRARARQEGRRVVKWADRARESRADDGDCDDEDPLGLEHVFEWRNNVRPGPPFTNSEESSGEQVVIRRHRRPTAPPDDVKAQRMGKFGKESD
ncbi:hypothetical protein V8F33_011427 [Rhypophila sp. PSN 637]